MRSNKYIDVRLVAPVDSGDLLAQLQEEGALGASEENGVIHLYWAARAWKSESQQKLNQVLEGLGANPNLAQLSVDTLEDQDWNARWAKSVQPIFIGRSILIRQSWNNDRVPDGGFDLIIDPKRAFGTGYHATTQLLAEWLEDIVRAGDRVLDIGTGSGILAMISLRLGAMYALGIDNDPVAIECARENAVMNHFGPELELALGSIEDLGPQEFEIILANLDRNTLLRSSAALAKNLHPGGRLLLSGLQDSDCDEILAVLATAKGQLRNRRVKDEWMALEVAFE